LSSLDEKSIVLGTVGGFRGNLGELTVRVVSGDAARWEHLHRVVLRGSGPGAPAGLREIASARAYRDRLVLKLVGVDDASAAAALRGCDVMAAAEDVPALPQGVYWVERLVGAQVKDAVLGDLGCVADVVETGGIDLLLVRDAGGVETLVPMAKEFVKDIDADAGLIQVALPEGLRGMNAAGGRETA
jgi:16S rRNA processing protein RimM